MTDLSVIIVSHDDRRWLDRCLRSVLAHAGDAQVEVVLVDNGTDGAARAVQAAFASVRVLAIENHGFAHANNRGVLVASGRYIVFLNPDTEIVDGDFSELVATLERRPEIGLVGVRQVTADGTLWPTIRYFPSISRALGDSLGAERSRWRARWVGERELNFSLYDREVECDWTSGSFMCARREALLGAGLMDERFFMYSEEPDLCLRIKRAGWSVRHLPQMTILHHAGKGGRPPLVQAQEAYSRRLYAHKHFAVPYRVGYLSMIGARHGLRAVAPGRSSGPSRRAAARLALSTLLGRTPPPFAQPPATAVRSCAQTATR